MYHFGDESGACVEVGTAPSGAKAHALEALDGTSKLLPVPFVLYAGFPEVLCCGTSFALVLSGQRFLSLHSFFHCTRFLRDTFLYEARYYARLLLGLVLSCADGAVWSGYGHRLNAALGRDFLERCHVAFL